MIGIVVGAVVALGVVGIARRVRRYRAYGGGGHGWRGRGFSRRGFWMRAIFMKLDTSPGQEKAIRAALEELRETAKGARDEAKAARSEVAQAIRGEVIDEGSIATAEVRVARVTDSMRKAARDAIAKIHDALDPRQRATLADLLESGGGWRGHGGPYRGAPTL